MSKCLVLFVEGETEIEFYKQVVAHVRKLHPQGMFDTNIEYKCIKGIADLRMKCLENLSRISKQNIKMIVCSKLFCAGTQMSLNFHRNLP